MRSAVVFVHGLLALAACDTYSPDLGTAPFQCGTAEPRCPDGYVCVEHGPVRRVCERPGELPDGGTDAAPPGCGDDLEPNDTRPSATVTPVAEIDPSYRADGLSLCPSGDRDLFRFALLSRDTAVRVRVTSTSADLSVTLQAKDGVQIDTAVPVGAGVLEIRIPRPTATTPLSADQFFIQVSSPNDSRPSYDFALETCMPASTCLP